MVQDEPKEGDNLYVVGNLQFIIGKEDEKEITHLGIHYERDWWGEDFIITAGF